VNEVYRHAEYAKTPRGLYWAFSAFGISVVSLSVIARSLIPIIIYLIIMFGYLFVSRYPSSIITVNKDGLEFDDLRPIFYRSRNQASVKVNIVWGSAPEVKFSMFGFPTIITNIVNTRITDVSALPWYRYQWSNPNYYPSGTRSKRAVILKSSSGFEFFIGTDDPENLERAIRQSLEARGQKLE
jgi:hypothetical protein